MGRVFITEGVRTGSDGSGYSCEDDDERADSWDVVDSDSGAKYFGSEDYSTATRVSGVLNAICREHAAEVARLNGQMRALAAENATLRNLQPTELMISSASANAEEYDNSNLDDDLIVFMWQAMHSVIKTPETDSYWREVAALAVEGYAAELYSEANEHAKNGLSKKDVVTCHAAAKAAEDYAARIRAGGVPNV